MTRWSQTPQRIPCEDELVAADESVVALEEVSVADEVELAGASQLSKEDEPEVSVAEPEVEEASQPSSDEELVSADDAVYSEPDEDASVCSVLGSDDPDAKLDELADWALTPAPNVAKAATMRLVGTFILVLPT
ncbi:uncharacterized protein KRP23_4384 [Phytophthora ramorum]|uniref:uncharacterized protein n=1 Tax=Phytophthora ramorum TaxID=164328 RepID=UPI0030A35820|nr:hypothetical protein KRP23_4384 [Phytophthora ramorum]